jgi:hypothetical protein
MSLNPNSRRLQNYIQTQGLGIKRAITLPCTVIPMKSILWIQNLGPLYVQCMTQKVVTYDEAVTGSNYFCYFRYFWTVCNKSQGKFCWKRKKVHNQPTPLHSTEGQGGEGYACSLGTEEFLNTVKAGIALQLPSKTHLKSSSGVIETA